MTINNKPSKKEAAEAIKLLLRFIGEDPSREGLIKTPERMLKSYEEMFSGYNQNAAEILETKFYDIEHFKDFVTLKDIGFKSFCEHHFLPISGKVDISYIPNGCVIGISKLPRIVEMFARRLQVQEKMTAQIAQTLQEYLNPLGVAIRVSASHSCMTMRGVMQDNSTMYTTHYTGIFTQDPQYRSEFLKALA